MRVFPLGLKAAALCSVLALAACSNEAGQNVDEGGFGRPTEANLMAMTGNATAALRTRFDAEVPSTITFPFNSSVITPEAAAILDQQANWIRQFPEVRFRVYGHTDLVGSDAYNKALGLRRAQAVVSYFAGQGISTARLEAVVSFGETQPVIFTQAPEQKNRRTVTEVTGFTKGAAGDLNGKYAEVIFREYVDSAKRPIATQSSTSNEVTPSSN